MIYATRWNILLLSFATIKDNTEKTDLMEFWNNMQNQYFVVLPLF